MTTVTLVYPYVRSDNDRSIFRFPPLGLGYIAAYLRQHKISVDLVDCTFLSEEEALRRVRDSGPRIIGIYSMFSMKRRALELARLLRDDCELLVAGGPLPTLNPQEFLQYFDVTVIGEGEETMLEIACTLEKDGDLSRVKGIAYKEKGTIRSNIHRRPISNLDKIPFPARDLFDNESYKDYYSERFGYTVTSMMTSRGCPFNCDFCSRPVFGNQFRARSAANIVDEMKAVLALGYDRIWFTDDCLTLNREGVLSLCDEIIQRGITIDWECLSRVDTVDREVTERMKQAGCKRVFFGIESGNDSVLALMGKQATAKKAAEAVQIAKRSRLEVGAFFIVGYPGETDETILDTLKFASRLPLDYLSFTLPYLIPGTPLFERMKDKIILEEWEEPRHIHIIDHKLLYRSDFSETKLKFAILKGSLQFELRKHLNAYGYQFIGEPFEHLTDFIFRLLN